MLQTIEQNRITKLLLVASGDISLVASVEYGTSDIVSCAVIIERYADENGMTFKEAWIELHRLRMIGLHETRLDEVTPDAGYRDSFQNWYLLMNSGRASEAAGNGNNNTQVNVVFSDSAGKPKGVF